MCEKPCDTTPRAIKCDTCRTINLANAPQVKTDMQPYEKCYRPRYADLPVTPTCIKIVSREEFRMKKLGRQVCIPKPPVGHGKLMYLVKAGILAGTAFFTYQQGIWGDQPQTVECSRRWQEYMRSFNSRRPPNFDKCGRVVSKPTTDSLLGPLYSVYKSIITTCFAGVVKFPVIAKCTYIKYLADLEQKRLQAKKEANLK